MNDFNLIAATTKQLWQWRWTKGRAPWEILPFLPPLGRGAELHHHDEASGRWCGKALKLKLKYSL